MAVSLAKLFWEQELRHLGGRGAAQGLEADEPRGGPAAQQRGCSGPSAQGRGSLPRLLQHKGPVTWPLGLPLERAPIVHASGFRAPDSVRTDFFCLFALKQQGLQPTAFPAPEGGSAQAHKPNRLLQVCFPDTLETARFRENSSHMLGPAFPERVQRLCCVNTAALSKSPSLGAGVMCQGKNTTQPRAAGGWCVVQREDGLPIGQGAPRLHSCH